MLMGGWGGFLLFLLRFDHQHKSGRTTSTNNGTREAMPALLLLALTDSVDNVAQNYFINA